MHSGKSFLMILMLVVCLASNCPGVEWVAYSNVAKLIALDDSRLAIEKQRSSTFSNKCVITADVVAYWSNRAQAERREKTWAVVKGGIAEAVLFGVLTFLAGKYLSK